MSDNHSKSSLQKKSKKPKKLTYLQKLIIGLSCSVVLLILVAALILTNHIYTYTESSATCTSGGVRTYTCVLCGETHSEIISDATGHVCSEWETDSEPTETDFGKRERVCKECGQVLDSELIYPLSPTPKVYIVYDTSAGEDSNADALFIGDEDISKRIVIDNEESSGIYKKRDFHISLVGGDGGDANISLFGLPSGCDYELLAGLKDQTHCRRLISARIWSAISQDQTGVCDGVTVMLYINNVYCGLYTLTPSVVPKYLGLSGPYAAITTTKFVDAANFEATAVFDGTDYTVEWCSDEDTSGMCESFNRFISFTMTSSDAEFAAGIGDYTDVDRLIDYIIFVYSVCGVYDSNVNILWVTDDGMHWDPTPCELTRTFGLSYDGLSVYDAKAILTPGRSGTSVYSSTSLLLFQRMFKLFGRQIMSRYANLRKGPLSDAAIFEIIDSVSSGVPSDRSIYEPLDPVLREKNNTVEQIIKFSNKRMKFLDSVFG